MKINKKKFLKFKQNNLKYFNKRSKLNLENSKFFDLDVIILIGKNNKKSW